MRYLTVLGFIMLGLLPVVGCGKKSGPQEAPPETKSQGGAVEVPAQFAAARKTFDANCTKCHSTDPTGGASKGGPGGFKRMRKGPNLARVGADAKHTREWFMDYIRNPKSQNPKASMPPFENKLDEDQLGALADYLTSLK